MSDPNHAALATVAGRDGDTDLLATIAVCPDDEGKLLSTGQSMRCANCAREFSLVAGQFWDLRPSRTFEEIAGKYAVNYLEHAHSTDRDAATRLPWGTLASLTPQERVHKSRHVEAVRALLAYPGNMLKESVLCDFSAGAGHYTLAFAPLCKRVVHCDLDPASLLYTAEKARALGLANFTFVRIDYLRPPFAQSRDLVFSFDSLIRGPRHEQELLRAIRRSLKPKGTGVLDFHNWWHNPLRRLGLLRQNFGENTSYTRRQAEALLATAGLRQQRYLGFRQENVPRVLQFMIPPTRFVYRVSPQ